MSANAKLIERLRASSDEVLHGPDGEWASGAYPTIYDEAADTIARLEEENGRLRDERDAFEKDCDYWSSETARVCGEASALSAAIIDLIGKDSPIEGILFGDFPDSKSITITALLGAFRRARALSTGDAG